MNTLRYILLAAVVVLVPACSDDDDPVAADPPAEFVATDADFSNYQSWEQPAGPFRGPDPAGVLGGAHNGNDSTMTRHIFINDNSVTRDGSGNFPNGTRLVKEMRDGDGTVVGVTAMVKRGGDFNSSHRGWEWMLLSSEGNIQNRGADLMNNACNSCHAVSASKDYVFVK